MRRECLCLQAVSYVCVGIVYSASEYIIYERKIRNRNDRGSVNRLRFHRQKQMMLRSVRVLSHTEPICVIQRVIMENRPFNCGHQTTNKQPSQSDRDDGKKKREKNFSFLC